VLHGFSPAAPRIQKNLLDAVTNYKPRVKSYFVTIPRRGQRPLLIGGSVLTRFPTFAISITTSATIT